MLIYQIYPRSFADSNADGMGDLKGITQHLDYVATLGVDAVWLSPFVQSPQKDYGYDVSDYCAVDARFGTLADFKILLRKAHALGLKIMMDQVWCHCSDQHAWFKESRASRKSKKSDWFIWADAKADGSPPNNWLSYFGGPAWTWDSGRGQYYFHQFLSSQPTFNLRHPQVTKALLNTGKFWLELGVDGFRLDAIHTGFCDPDLKNNPAKARADAYSPDVPEMTPQARQIRLYSEGHIDTLPFLQEVRKLADRYGATLLGEVGGTDPYARAALYTQNKRLHMAYTFGLLGVKPDARHFRDMVVDGHNKKADGDFCYALSNHDVRRVVTRWKTKGVPDNRVAKTALLFGLCLPGHYCMYQGEELGLGEAVVPYEKMRDPFGLTFYPKFVGRDGCRTPYPWDNAKPNAGFSKVAETWLPFFEAHRKLAVNVQEKDKASTLHYTRQLLKWRRQQRALAGDGFKPVATQGDVVAFRRRAEGQTLMCVFNLGAKPANVKLPVNCAPLWQVAAAIKGHNVRLQPMGSIVLQVDAVPRRKP